MSSQFSLLKKRSFLPILLTQLFGILNDNTFKNALIILTTYKLANTLNFIDPKLIITSAAGIFILPLFLFSGLAGQFSEKYEKSKMAQIIKIFEIVLMLFVSVGFYFGNIFILLCGLFFMGLHSTFFTPIKYSILPEQLDNNELLGGNALINSGTFLSNLLGTIIGGSCIMFENGIYIVSFLLLAFAILGYISSKFIINTGIKKQDLKINYNIFTNTFDLIKAIGIKKSIFLSGMGISWFWFVSATFATQFPNFVKFAIGGDQSIVILFLSTFSIGIALGSLLCSKILRGLIHSTYVPIFVLFISLFAFDLYILGSNLPTTYNLISIGEFLSNFKNIRIVLDILAIAICSGMYIIPLYAIIQKDSTADNRTRIIAGLNILDALFIVISAISASLILKFGYSIVSIFLFVAIVNLFVAIYVCKLLPDSLIKSIFQFILKGLFDVDIKGLENYANIKSKTLIIANHTSFLDAALIYAFIPDKLIFAVDTEIAKKFWIKPFLKLVDAYSIDPTNPLALKTLINFVKDGKKVVIFPEGRITVTGALMKIYEGPGMIAEKAGADILPIRIDGAQYSKFSRLNGKIKTKYFPKISMQILKPTNFVLDKTLSPREKRKVSGNKLHDLMVEMVFESSDYNKTIFESLIDAKDIHGSNHIIAEDTNFVPISYKQLITKSFALGHHTSKITKNCEYVGILMPNSIPAIVSFLGLHSFNRVPVMLNFSSGMSNILSACKTSKLNIVYTSKTFVEKAKLESRIDLLKQNGIKVIFLEDLKNNMSIFSKIYSLFAGNFPRIFYKLTNFRNISATNPAVVLFTSGSEGTPKGVVLSHLNIQANRYQLGSKVDFTSRDIIFNILPVFHSFGLTAGTILPLLSGIKVFLYPSPLHYKIIPELIYRTNATIVFGTNTFLDRYAKSANSYDFYSLRYAFAGAEKLQESTKRIWSENFGVRVFEGYGTTETAPVIAVNTPMKNKFGSVGKMLPGIKYEIEKISGIENGGKLIVSGPNVMLGYIFAKNPGEIIKPNNNTHDTGDIVEIDNDGYIFIKGRLKRFAKIAGEMISMPYVEEEIAKFLSNNTSAIISRPDEKKGEKLILITDKVDLIFNDLTSCLKKSGMSDLAMPKSFIYVEKLPLLGTGKIDYVKLNELVAEL